nr:PREDICTED: complexin-2 [Latimeria chalumnae]|eukprot:XP_005993446.1 PREDICTED: complexin-2 [Latimeria chalumnae]
MEQRLQQLIDLIARGNQWREELDCQMQEGFQQLCEDISQMVDALWGMAASQAHSVDALFTMAEALRQQSLCQDAGVGATKDMGKMLGGEEEKDPDAQKKEEERQEALRQQEEERKAKHARMEAEREKVRQSIRDKYGLKKKEEREAEEKAAMEQPCEGSLTRPKKAIPAGCGDEDDEEEESILDTVLKYLPGPLQDMFKK